MARSLTFVRNSSFGSVLNSSSCLAGWFWTTSTAGTLSTVQLLTASRTVVGVGPVREHLRVVRGKPGTPTKFVTLNDSYPCLSLNGLMRRGSVQDRVAATLHQPPANRDCTFASSVTDSVQPLAGFEPEAGQVSRKECWNRFGRSMSAGICDPPLTRKRHTLLTAQSDHYARVLECSGTECCYTEYS